MDCPQCGKANQEEASFCAHCGAPLEDISSLATRVPAEGESLSSSQGSIPGGSTSAEGVVSMPTGPEAGFPPGTIVAGRYRIVGLLGKGGMGRVYRADDLTLGQPVALKFLPPEFLADPARRDRFRAEVRLARRVTHPNVCRVHDLGEIDGQPYISMELVEGGDLTSLLRRIGRLSTDKGLEIARQLCAGLAAAHEKGVVHRDLKPANVMLDETGRVRITDFGLAAVAGDVKGAEVRSGTPAYMAPEALQGKEATERSDIYALGLVLYEIFTGRRAFEGRSLAELTRQQIETMPPDPSELVEDLDPAIGEVLTWCLEKDPARRPPGALAVAAKLPGGDPLAAVLAAGETPSPELLAEAGERDALSPLFAWGLALLCLVLLAGGAMWRSTTLAIHRAGLTRSGEVLADRARESLTALLGTPLPEGDQAWGFRYDDVLIRELDHQAGKGTWLEAARSELAPVWFWYRASPDHLWPQSIGGAVSSGEPVPWKAGEIVAKFDVRGRLLGLRRIPRDEDLSAAAGENGQTAPAPDWKALIGATALPWDRLEPVEPDKVPPVFADARAAWDLPPSGERPWKLHVEAAALRGRPVSLSIKGSWTEKAAEGGTRSSNSQAAQVTSILLLLIALAAGIILARRNLHVGRGDLRGATGIAAALAGVEFLSFLVGAHHGGGISLETILLFRGAGWALFIGAVTWLFYVALEPGVRRRWARSMVGWLRLRSADFRDPKVGREILFGTLLGCVGLILDQFALALAQGRGAGLGTSMSYLQPIMGLRGIIAMVADTLRGAGFGGLFVLLLLLLLHLLLRRRWAALTALTVILGAQSMLSQQNVYTMVFVALMMVLLVLVLNWLGWLCLVVGMFLGNLLGGAPLSLDPGSLGFPATVCCLLIVAALALWGAWAASGAARSRA